VGVPQVLLRVRTASGEVSLHTFDFTPVSIASFGSPDLLLPGPASRKLRLLLDLRPGPALQAWLTADSPLLVNGVPHRQKALKPGDRILFGSHRLEFLGAQVRRTTQPLPQTPAFGWQLPGIAALLFLGILFGRSGSPPPARPASRARSPAVQPSAPRELPSPAARAPERALRVPQRPAPETKDQPVPAVTGRDATPAKKAPERVSAPKDVLKPAAVARIPADKESRQPAAVVKHTAVKRSLKSERETPSGRASPPPLTEVRVTAPGEAIEYFPADILFLHAHPDDESLAFGAMMAAASRSGKRLATVLFTDGEAGKDIYPNRPTGRLYPNQALHGAELAEVRVQEARRALAILGCEGYIRLGFKNHPYNGLHDEVSAEQVIADWGGEQELVARLETLLRGFRPRIVVSPGGHSGQHGHFEHEAVGLLVARAVEGLRREGADFLQGHLVPVDPAARGRYPTLVEIDARAADPAGGLTYRQIQALALREHVSQRDASVLGRKRLMRLSKEYYRSLDWELGVSLQEYLAQPLTAKRAGAF
jgi:LmbE family N-acetylglucosaminyl deacetylase